MYRAVSAILFSCCKQKSPLIRKGYSSIEHSTQSQNFVIDCVYITINGCQLVLTACIIFPINLINIIFQTSKKSKRWRSKKTMW
jgi:hypothetical protein